MKEYRLLPFLLAIALAAPARAVSVSPVGSNSSYQVTIPRSRIEMPKLSEPESARVPDQLDLGASSWTPEGFSLPSRPRDTSNFSRSETPSFYVNYLKSVTPIDGIYLKAGLNWLSLTRSGKVGSESASALENQSLQLLSLRLGAEYAPVSLAIPALLGAQPYAALSLLPSLGMTGRSAFDDGSSYFGVPIEYSAGALFELSQFGLGWNHAHVDLGLMGTAGTVDHSSVAGIGIKGGIRVAL